MASTNKTPNYNLSQFEPTNKLERTDYNSDMTKIDAALKANADNIGLLSYQLSSGSSNLATNAQDIFNTLPVGATRMGLCATSLQWLTWIGSKYSATSGGILFFGAEAKPRHCGYHNGVWTVTEL